MEAMLSNAAGQSAEVAAVANSGKFGKDWRAALSKVGESTKEFDAYEGHFYQNLRIPLTHLHGKTREKTQERLQQINDMDFPEVYNGMRYGWWAHIRLLRGISLGTGDIQKEWDAICRDGARIPPNLFLESHPDRLPKS
jgi:hypothetical protein